MASRRARQPESGIPPATASLQPRPGVAISVVVPVHDEEGNVEPLYRSLVEALDALGRTYEMIVVDDGSGDETYPRLLGLQPPTRDLKLVQLRRNFGQTAAMAAGFDHARGEVIVPMDGDLQNDPADIPRLSRRSTRATTSSAAGDATGRTASCGACRRGWRTG